MQLEGLHLLLTYQCTYECDHCFVRSSPFAEGTMTSAQAKNAILQGYEVNRNIGIYFEGGEPFLYYPVLLDAVRYAKNLGLKVGIVTNGYYGKCIEDAVLWLEPLRDLGVDSISISDDGFHSSADDGQTPASLVREAACRIGLEAGTITIDEPCTHEDPHKPGTPILGGSVRFRGRAVEKLADENLHRQDWTVFNECPYEDWVGIGRLHLDAYSNLYPCQGIVVGNLEATTLEEVIRTYNPVTHPIVAPILRGGPVELVREFDLDLKRTYHDACHLCFLARTELLDRFPHHLAPTQVYRD